MEKVEKFIHEHTKKCCNVCSYNSLECEIPWLTPDDVRKVAEIARKETFDKIWHWLAEHINDYVVEGKGKDIDLMFDDIKQAMKNE